MDSFKNKTLLLKNQERNEVSCEQSRRDLIVEVVVEPVVVPVPLPVVPVEVTDVQVVIGVAVLL